jgi:hypothetical protein
MLRSVANVFIAGDTAARARYRHAHSARLFPLTYTAVHRSSTTLCVCVLVVYGWIILRHACYIDCTASMVGCFMNYELESIWNYCPGMCYGD